MEKQKNRKPLIVGIIAAVVVFAVLLALVLTQCVGGASNATTAPATEDTAAVVATYELYWNIDRAEYDGKSEAGMSSRMPEEDGYFHVRFFTEGEEVTLKVADRKLINAIDVQDVMGLEFDDNGIVIGVLNLDDMPLEKLAWKFFVQSSAKGIIKANSSESFMGMPLMMEDLDPNRIWDMSGRSGPIGTVAEPIQFDRFCAIANLAGEVTHVFIYERPYYMNSHMAMCEHCKEEVEWKEWIRADAFPGVSGHYQLNTDIQLTGQVSMAADTKMCLDLNGHRIDGKENARAISMHNSGITFAVMDSSEKQTGVIACRGKVDQGGCVWVRFGAFYLYGGTLDASKAYSEICAPALECEKDCFAYMNGGKIIGGEARYLYNAEKNSYSRGFGGAMRIGGKFVLNDGIVEGGKAQSAVVYDDKGTPVYKCGTGGNIFLQTGSAFEMNGGIIRNGRSGGGGANIYADGTAEITMNGGSIQGGVTNGRSKSGGSIYLGSKATMTMNGGTITGGVCYNGGGNIFVGGTFIMNGGYIGGGACYTYGTGKRNTGSTSDNITVVNATMIMWGGRIDGGVSPIDTNATDKKQTAMYINGVAQITGGTDQKDLTISTGGSGVKVYVGTLYEGAKIGIHVTTGIFSEPTKEEYKKYFYSTLKGADVVYYEGCLGLGKVSCICGNSQGELVSEEHDLGCDGKVLMWTPWRSTTSVPTTSGNHYLLDNVTTKSQSLVRIGQDVKLDLNGKNITLQVGSDKADAFRLYRVDDGSKLAITDTTDKPGTLKTIMPGEDAVYNGKTVKTKAEKDEEGNVIKEAVYFTEEEMRQKWAAGNNGMLLWAPGGEITIHDGIIDGSNLTGSKDGMVIYLDHKTVTNEETGEKTTYKGKLNMYGGTVLCGYTTGNGNVNISKAGNVMNIYGGTITGGRSGRGGNICLTAGELNMYGGTVTKGVCDRSADEVDGGLGGNIVVDYGTTMNLYGGTISDGFVVGGKKGGGHGGNIKVFGTLNAYGGVISGGQTSSSGGNIAAIGSTSKLLLDGVQILDGVAANGGNVGLNVRAGLGLTITEATVISGGVAKKGNGGNVYINIFNQQGRGVTLPVTLNGTITGGSAAQSGGNIYVNNTLQTATATAEAKPQDILQLTMKGTVVSGGTAKNSADSNIYLYNAEADLDSIQVGGGMTVAHSTVSLSGKPVIAADNGGLTFEDSFKVEAVLAEGSQIYVSGSGFVTEKTDAKNLAYFHSLGEYPVLMAEDRVFIGNYSCLCGKETHTEGCVAAMTHLLEKEGKTYSADAKIAMLPLTSFDQLKSGGNWYLHEDLTTATSVILPAGNSLVLDLNGHEINVTQQSFLLSTQGGSNHDVSVVITDSSDLGGGAIRLASANTTVNQGGILRAVNGNGTNAAYLLGGTLDASGYQLTNVGGTAIYVDGKSNFYMYGGSVVGTAGEQLTTGGGAIRVVDGKFYLYDGTILGGKAANGGNVWISGNGSLEMLGGSITGGSLNKADGLGANLLVEGTLTMRGGSIAGGVYITGSKSAITGNAVIDKTLTGSEYTAPAYSLQIAKDNSFNVSGLNGGKIYVTAEGMFGTEADENAKASVYSEMEGKSVSLYENALHVGLVYCACGGKAEGMEGHTCQNILWSDWEDPNALPKEAGNWRLTTDVTITSFVDINKAGWVMNLDLNGHSITNTVASAKTGKVFQITQGTLSITDSSEEETGIIIGNNIYGDGGRGGTIRVGESSTGATLYIYGGTITHTAADAESATKANSPSHGGVIELKGTSGAVMYGGIIQGGKTTGVGGNVMMDNSSTFTMYGGTIQDGYSASGGGNVAVHSSATFTMYGGNILGGESGKNGGCFNVVESGKLMLVDGTVTGGKSVGSGANVNLDGANTTFTMSGGTVAGGVYVPNSKATISGDAIIDKSLTEAGKTVPAYSLKLTKGNTLDVTGLTGGNINVLAEGKFALNADENAKTSVYTEVAKTEVVLYEDALHMGLRYCVCGGKAQGMKDHTCQDITWLDWTETTSLPTSGNWRLTQPVNLEAEALYSGNTTVMNLDLNGQSITSKGRVFWVDKDAQLSITNTGAEDTAIVMGAYSGSGTRGGTILVGQTTISSGKLNIYGGTFTHISGTDSSKTVQHGGVLDIRCGSQVKFYGGTITGARTTHVGGNLIVDNTATMTMYGGTISNGYSPKDGGNVAVHGKSFTIYGGTITGGQGQNGGNINVVNGKALNIHGGTITGGTATGSGVNVNMAGANSVLTMTSGVIAGGVYVANSKSAISGNAVINKNLTESGKPVPAYGLKITEGNTINVEGFSGGIVYVLADEKFATNADRAAEEGFIGEVEGKIVALLDGELHMRPYYCTCGGKAQGMEGHTCQNVVWLDWTDGTSLPKVGGNWRLTTDVTITSFVDVNNTNWVLNLDLNGHNITNTAAKSKEGKVFQITKGTLSITDSSTEKTGIITGSNVTGRGGTIRMGESSTGATLYIYGGIFTHSSATADTITSANAPAHGGVIDLVGTSTMVMYGGTIQGGGTTGNGGNIMVDNKATVTMYGGTIIGGRAKNGGNVAVHTSAGFVVREGTITDGTATVSGPNVHVDALNVFKMYGGTVAGGVNVPGKSDGTPNNNTVISGNAVINKALTGANATAPTYSLNLASGATINVEGFSGGTVYVTADGLFAINAVERNGFESEVEDRTVTQMDSNLILRPYYCACGGKAQGMEGHSCQRLIWLDWTETTSLPTSGNWRLTQPVNLEAEALYSGSTTVVNLDLNGQSITSKGRVFWVDKDAQLSITNTGAEATAVVTGALVGSGNRGGTILVGNETSGKLNIYGGTFTHTSSTATAADSTNAVAQGGVMDIRKTSVVNIYGGTFVGGKTTGNGGNIMLDNTAELHMYGGSILNGWALRGGNVAVHSSVGFTLHDGLISGGYANNNNGGNISISGAAKMTMKGGQVKDGSGANLTSGTEICLTNGTLKIEGGTISNAASGSVSVAIGYMKNTNYSGTIEMTGGTIQSGNVYVYRGGTFKHTANAVLSGISILNHANDKLVKTEADGVTTYKAQAK